MVKVFLMLLLMLAAAATKHASTAMERRLLSNATVADYMVDSNSRRNLGACVDTSAGYCDSYGDCCDEYHSNKNWCGNYDTSNFKSKAMCCACGGGKDRVGASVDVAVGGSFCDKVIDLTNLNTESKEYSTKGSGNDISTLSCGQGGRGEERVFKYLLGVGEKLEIWQSHNNYDSVHELRVGSSCMDNRVIACQDDPDTTTMSWTNNGKYETYAFFIVDSYGTRSGTFKLNWKRTKKAAASVDCMGSWGACGTTCEQIYSIATPASNGGSACEEAEAATQACTGGQCVPAAAVDCMGSWGACGTTCEQIYSIATPASNGGSACEEAEAATQACTGGQCVPGGTKDWCDCGKTGQLEVWSHGTQRYRLNARDHYQVINWGKRVREVFWRCTGGGGNQRAYFGDGGSVWSVKFKHENKTCRKNGDWWVSRHRSGRIYWK